MARAKRQTAAAGRAAAHYGSAPLGSFPVVSIDNDPHANGDWLATVKMEGTLVDDARFPTKAEAQAWARSLYRVQV